MADYWKSQPKKFCTYCKCWIADNKPSVEFHERGKNHKENVIKKISEIKQKSMAKAKADEKMSKEFAAMEEAALKAYEEDLKRLEGTKPAPVGPTIEERRARDEQKRKEIEALEKHHARKRWTKAFSPEGFTYYYNELTGETQWEEPDGFQENKNKSEEQGAKPVWVEGVSEEGYTYYYNNETGESKWENPEGFDALPPTEDQERTPDKQDTTVEEEAGSVEQKSEATSDESNPSEEATPAPSVSKTKINFRSKKEEKKEDTLESDIKEEDTEVKQETEEKGSSLQLPKQRPKKANPYGAWEQVKEEEDPYENVDLELPNFDYDDDLQVSVPDLPEEPKVKFKEKTITTLGDTAAGVSVFKKRKLENVKPRNIRQRLNDQ
ncbi:PREDICTED: WW domain-binding protein 4 [Nanorana parkeri]|uniref:WW domain-binding protein 4 n=1 Tax=Nanorana parkeri TaxID=125878 RepID=UPI000854B711|nr:PREDICTED: WW domain-binding protein 4 [Nanorana parkeri]